jgi:hypothetical protein
MAPFGLTLAALLTQSIRRCCDTACTAGRIPVRLGAFGSGAQQVTGFAPLQPRSQLWQAVSGSRTRGCALLDVSLHTVRLTPSTTSNCARGENRSAAARRSSVRSTRPGQRPTVASGRPVTPAGLKAGPGVRPVDSVTLNDGEGHGNRARSRSVRRRERDGTARPLAYQGGRRAAKGEQPGVSSRTRACPASGATPRTGPSGLPPAGGRELGARDGRPRDLPGAATEVMLGLAPGIPLPVPAQNDGGHLDPAQALRCTSIWRRTPSECRAGRRRYPGSGPLGGLLIPASAPACRPPVTGPSV